MTEQTQSIYIPIHVLVHVGLRAHEAKPSFSFTQPHSVGPNIVYMILTI